MEIQNERPGVVQRAFEIARSGKVANIAALLTQLAAEEYVNGPQILAGRAVSHQLARIILEARTTK